MPFLDRSHLLWSKISLHLRHWCPDRHSHHCRRYLLPSRDEPRCTMGSSDIHHAMGVCVRHYHRSDGLRRRRRDFLDTTPGKDYRSQQELLQSDWCLGKYPMHVSTQPYCSQLERQGQLPVGRHRGAHVRLEHLPITRVQR